MKWTKFLAFAAMMATALFAVVSCSSDDDTDGEIIGGGMSKEMLGTYKGALTSKVMGQNVEQKDMQIELVMSEDGKSVDAKFAPIMAFHGNYVSGVVLHDVKVVKKEGKVEIFAAKQVNDGGELGPIGAENPLMIFKNEVSFKGSLKGKVLTGTLRWMPKDLKNPEHPDHPLEFPAKGGINFSFSGVK